MMNGVKPGDVVWWFDGMLAAERVEVLEAHGASGPSDAAEWVIIRRPDDRTKVTTPGYLYATAHDAADEMRDHAGYLLRSADRLESGVE